MATKGERKNQKSLSASKARSFNRKEQVWTTKSRSGPHNGDKSVPLVFVARNMLGLATNLKEVKAVLYNRDVKVNGRARTSPNFPVGVFDVIDVEKTGQRFRLVFDEKGRLTAREIKAEGKAFRISKIERKAIKKKGEVQLTTDDGINVVVKKTGLKKGDSVKLEFPENKVAGEFAMKKGSAAFVIGGTHIGVLAIIGEIVQGDQKRDTLVKLEKGKESFLTPSKNIMVVDPKMEIFEKVK